MVTLTVQDSITYAETLIKNQRLRVNNMQPGLKCANNTLQMILNAPMIWRFNRKKLSFTIAGTGTDYLMSLPNLGRIETQWLTDASGKIFDLEGAQELAQVSTTRRPMKVAPVYDDNLGNINFRFNSIPDKTYTANFDYQQKAPLIKSFADTIGPVPDEFSFLFDKLFLSEAALLVNDSRFTVWRQEGLAGLLATQDGLDAQAKSLFYDQMLNAGRTATRSQAAGQGGAQGARI